MRARDVVHHACETLIGAEHPFFYDFLVAVRFRTPSLTCNISYAMQCVRTSAYPWIYESAWKYVWRFQKFPAALTSNACGRICFIEHILWILNTFTSHRIKCICILISISENSVFYINTCASQPTSSRYTVAYLWRPRWWIIFTLGWWLISCAVAVKLRFGGKCSAANT